jgi:hypothetical protein
MAVDATNTRFDSGQQSNFKDSQEARFRRNCRDAIRRSQLTRTEKEIAICFLNHWFVHRHKGAVHPGRSKIAKRTGASIKTVSRTFALLRDCHVIEATAFLSGMNGKATEYAVDTRFLFWLHKLDKATFRAFKAARLAKEKQEASANGGTNVPGSGRVKMSRRNKPSNVIAFPKQGGGQ